MGQIQVLPDILASQVAAGEVVERPASVAKELVENSIDAGARRITVEFQGGGSRLLRVTDDGSGMDRSDALLCLERHATSKIRKSADLSAITTLGFRGEALPSIASVSRFRLSTRRREEDEGTLVEVTGGKVTDVKGSGEAPGTRIEVADLFFNVPARRKFLRGEQTEASHLIQQLQFLAVAHPEIAFTCLRDGKEVFRLAATRDPAVRLRDLHGEEFLGRLLPVPPVERGGVKVRGWMARPGEGRSDRTHQMTFVNGRIIRSPVLSLPLREACDGVLAKGLHPPAVLFFEVDPIAVDCNVHPAKREVRFRDPSLLRSAALLAARSAWGALPGKPELRTDDLPDPLFPPLPNIPKNAVPPGSPPENPLGSASYQREFQAEQDAGRVRESREGMAGGYGRASSIRYLGILAGIYLLFEEGGALLLLEIRAARERILYERLFGQLGNGSIESQRLLIPEVLELSPADILWIEAHASLLHASGLSAEPFGAGSLKVDAVPSDTASLPVSDVVSGLLDDLRSLGDSPSPGLPEREALAASVSRLSARAGSLPGGEDAAVLLFRDLLSCSLPYVTPGGRPTMVQFSPGELQRRFTA